VSRAAFVVLVAAVGATRLLELRISRRHARVLVGAGARPVPEPAFPWMVLVHVAVLAGALLEVMLLRRRARPALAAPMAGLVALATGLRWWVIRTLGSHWNARVVDSTVLGIVTDGPYRWVRHPNYVAVALELAALPLVHGAWLTALLGSLADALVLRRRVAAEEAVLLADPTYRRLMAPRPRFVPRLAWPTS
jgi:methyltransferase